MKNPSNTSADPMIRAAAMLVCVLLVDANIILLSLPLLLYTLMLAGVPELQATIATMDSLFVSVPVVLSATAIIFRARGRRKRRGNQQSVTPAPRIIENRSSRLTAGMC